jgi:hypothetical protein
MNMTTKINQLLQLTPKGTVLLTDEMKNNGFSYSLQQRYRNSQWLTAIGKGAMIRKGDEMLLAGALSCLQQQCRSNIHIGGLSSLELLGAAHYFRLGTDTMQLFLSERKLLPLWFMKNKWNHTFQINKLSVFNSQDVDLQDYKLDGFNVKISGQSKAIMEVLSLCPYKFSLSESYELMESLTGLRPVVVQRLLENCKSVKLKRLFLCFAEKINHAWFKYLDLTKIDIGSGKRSFAKIDGVYISKYQLVLPKGIV